jgi:hypothetical protein
MLILELGLWVLPFTLMLAPARRMVHLVQELQRILLVFVCGRRRRSGTTAFGEVWSRLDRLDSATVIA